MKGAVLYYDGFTEFEVVIACGNIATLGDGKGEIVAVALENRPYRSEEKQRFLPDKTIDNLNADDVDVFLIPGGDITPIIDDPRLKKLLTALNEKNKVIGAICGGVNILGYTGLLENRRFTCSAAGYPPDRETLAKYFKDCIFVDNDVVVDDNIITAQGQAFIEFGVEIAQKMGFYRDEQERERDYKWIKNLK